jgi:hypothetical protein
MLPKFTFIFHPKMYCREMGHDVKRIYLTRDSSNSDLQGHGDESLGSTTANVLITVVTIKCPCGSFRSLRKRVLRRADNSLPVNACKNR